MRLHFAICFSLLLAVPLAGCRALLPKLEAPQVQLTGLTLNGGSLNHQRMNIVLHVTNPNNRALGVAGIDYRVEIAGAQVLVGTTAAPFTLPAKGETDIDLLATVDLAMAAQLWLEHRGEPDVDYHVVATVRVESPFFFSWPVDAHGRVKLP
jgi:LEA14-like dessication related protein